LENIVPDGEDIGQTEEIDTTEDNSLESEEG